LPLYSNAKELMRANLTAIAAGQKVRSIAIGTLSQAQLDKINEERLEEEMPPIVAEVIFVGAHVYKSRVLRDNYEIEDIIEEADSALSDASEVIYTNYMTAIQNPNPRADRLGNQVNDRMIFECTKYRPNPEMLSTVPKGDKIKPAPKQKGPLSQPPA
jgi:hypothetical protein